MRSNLFTGKRFLVKLNLKKMNKTIFRIAKMDCPSEIQQIKMKLDGLDQIQSMNFDLNLRQLTVLHNNTHQPILERLEELQFNTSLVQIGKTEDVASANDKKLERSLLWKVLFINAFFFILEILVGFWARSMGLVADSLDMLADSLVYGMALWAVGGSLLRKRRVAQWAGYFQLILAVGGLVEVIRRFLNFETVPFFQAMIFISVLALIGNTISLYLLQRSQSKEVHMQASMIFTSNDIVVNLGVIVAGGLVFLTQSKWPDLIVGTLVFMLVARGAYRILKQAHR